MGIWEYSEYYSPQIEEQFQISLDEGNTPLETNKELAEKLGIKSIYLKREDQNPSGSHKDRGLAFQISAHLQNGDKEYVVSSTGNTAISAIHLCKKAGTKIHIFLANKLPHHKQLRLEAALGTKFSSKANQDFKYKNATLHFSQKPSSGAFQFAQENNLPLIRGSKDSYAPEGYKSIALEIVADQINEKLIFIPTSSGTTALGIYQGYLQLKNEGVLKQEIPQIHIVQTQRVNTIAREYDKEFESSLESDVDSISDRVAHRKSQIDQAIQQSNGSGWVVSDEEIHKADELLRECNVKASLEGAMTIAAITKAKSRGLNVNNAVCLITGTINK